jgi:hypothetical protein
VTRLFRVTNDSLDASLIYFSGIVSGGRRSTSLSCSSTLVLQPSMLRLRASCARGQQGGAQDARPGEQRGGRRGPPRSCWHGVWPGLPGAVLPRSFLASHRVAHKTRGRNYPFLPIVELVVSLRVGLWADVVSCMPTMVRVSGANF